MISANEVMNSSYDYGLVILSVLTAWLTARATADGIGTWSIHYTEKLAFHLPVPVRYDWPTVLPSLLVYRDGLMSFIVCLTSSQNKWSG